MAWTFCRVSGIEGNFTLKKGHTPLFRLGIGIGILDLDLDMDLGLDWDWNLVYAVRALVCGDIECLWRLLFSYYAFLFGFFDNYIFVNFCGCVNLILF